MIKIPKIIARDESSEVDKLFIIKFYLKILFVGLSKVQVNYLRIRQHLDHLNFVNFLCPTPKQRLSQDFFRMFRISTSMFYYTTINCGSKSTICDQTFWTFPILGPIQLQIHFNCAQHSQKFVLNCFHLLNEKFTLHHKKQNTRGNSRL